MIQSRKSVFFLEVQNFQPEVSYTATRQEGDTKIPEYVNCDYLQLQIGLGLALRCLYNIQICPWRTYCITQPIEYRDSTRLHWRSHTTSSRAVIGQSRRFGPISLLRSAHIVSLCTSRKEVIIARHIQLKIWHVTLESHMVCAYILIRSLQGSLQ